MWHRSLRRCRKRAEKDGKNEIFDFVRGVGAVGVKHQTGATEKGDRVRKGLSLMGGDGHYVPSPVQAGGLRVRRQKKATTKQRTNGVMGAGRR